MSFYSILSVDFRPLGAFEFTGEFKGPAARQCLGARSPWRRRVRSSVAKLNREFADIHLSLQWRNLGIRKVKQVSENSPNSTRIAHLREANRFVGSEITLASGFFRQPGYPGPALPVDAPGSGRMQSVDMSKASVIFAGRSRMACAAVNISCYGLRLIRGITIGVSSATGSSPSSRLTELAAKRAGDGPT